MRVEDAIMMLDVLLLVWSSFSRTNEILAECLDSELLVCRSGVVVRC